MDKNEILAKSRNENKNTDERENIIKKNAYLISTVAGLIVCSIFLLLKNTIQHILLYGFQ